MSVVKTQKPATGKKKKSFLDAFRPKGNQPVWKFALIWFLKISLFGLFLMSVLFVLVYIGTFGELPDAETLIKIKPTALYLLFAGALFAGLALRKPILKILFDGALHVTEEGWRRLTWRWALFFVALAIVNELVWRTQTTDLWVKFKTFGFLPLTLLFALAQAPLITKHETKEDEASGDDF